MHLLFCNRVTTVHFAPKVRVLIYNQEQISPSVDGDLIGELICTCLTVQAIITPPPSSLAAVQPRMV